MKKLKQIAATLVSVILAGTVTVNASAAESMETPYRSPTLSSFPSNASLEDLEKASDNEDLRIISSPSRGANYKTRAAEAVALLRIYSTTGSAQVVPEKLRTLDHGRPWSDDQFASTRLSSNRDMSR